MTTKTMLIVDDSRLSRMMIKNFTLAHQPDWLILEACHGEEAFSICEGHDISCMTIDYNMPGEDGLSVAQKLQTFYPQANIAILTANIQAFLIEEVESKGIKFIDKPITESKIEAYVKGGK